MKIAFVLPSESNPLQSLYLDHVKRSCEAICELGYEATLYSSGIVPDELIEIDAVAHRPVSFLSLEQSDRYHSDYQAHSDHLLSALLGEEGACEFDVVEFPLWEAIGFSAIRAKRLLGIFKDTKLVVNVDLSQLLLEQIDDEYLPNYESEVVSHMELYMLRYADQLQSGIGAYGSVVRSISGRNDLQFYDSSGLGACSDEVQSESRELAILKSWVKESSSNVEIQSVDELFQSEGRRIYGRKKNSSTVTFLVPYHEEILAGGVDETDGLIDEERGEVVYYNPSDAESYTEFYPEKGRKSDWDATIQSFDVLLNECSTDYVLFAQVGSVSALYLDLATCALNKNPELAYVGAYLGGQSKYGVGYIPSLSRLANLSCPVANVFRKSALEKIASDITIKDCVGFEWELMVALDDKYQVGDLIPHVFFDIPQDDEACLTARDILRSRKRLGGAKAVRAMTLLIESPELLSMMGSTTAVGSFEWDFRLPLEMKLETAVSEVVELEEQVEEPSVEGFEVGNDLSESSSDGALSFDEFEDPLKLAEENNESEDFAEDTDELEGLSEETDESEDLSEEVNEISEASKALLEMEKSLSEEYPVDEISEPEEDEEENEEDFPEEPVLTIQYSVESASEVLIDDTEDADESSLRLSDVAEPEIADSEDDYYSEEVVETDIAESEATDDESSLESATLNEETFEDDDSFQLFWGKDFGFSEVESIKKDASLGEALFVEFSVESAETVNTLRLDPCNREGLVHLRKIQVLDDSTGLTVFSSCEENAFDHIQPTGDFDVEGVEEDALLLKSHGSDPQILVTLGELLLQKFTVRVEYGYEN